MMDLSLYFDPVSIASLHIPDAESMTDRLLYRVMMYNPEASVNIEEADIAIVGVPEVRNAWQNPSCSLAPDEIRRQFYQLYAWRKDVRIIDLGNLRLGMSVEDTYHAVLEVIAYLVENNVVPVVLGGSNDLAFANYRAYEMMERVANVVSIDSCFDLGNENQPIRSDAYVNKMVLQQPNFLLNYANIGFQSYMNSPESVNMMESLFFETYRVGLLRRNLEEVEPIVRNADMVSLDISAVRRPDAPGCPHNSSNGFYGEEICQIAKFVGLSDKLSSFGIYEYDPTLDFNNQTSQLIAHILWYFVEGFLFRQSEGHFKNKGDYRQFNISVTGALEEMVFFNSKKSDRWWVIVPMYQKGKDQVQNYYLPCSRRDYQLACEDKISDRWWRTYHKINQ
ncbi:MAG: formimidoylglutamase [Bacteroidales bacterium]|nr:formimidoylglutamase [Bacteroidales bacterium]